MYISCTFNSGFSWRCGITFDLSEYLIRVFTLFTPATDGRGGFRGGGEGAASPLSSGYHFLRYLSSSGVSKNSELAQFCCSQTVKSNILLSQNAGNAISETLDVQNFPGGGMTLDARPPPPPPPPQAGLGPRPRTTATRSPTNPITPRMYLLVALSC